MPENRHKIVDEIPDGWREVTIGDVFDFKNGINKAKEFFGQGTPIINYMDVYGSSFLLGRNIKGRVTVTNQELRAYEVRKGDVFFTRTSETTDEIGVSSVLIENVPEAIFSGFILRARPKINILTDNFKKYCFSTKAVRDQIVSKSTYTTRALTNGRLLSTVSLSIPSTEAEQESIAAALSDADALIESLEQLIVKKRQIKTGAMQDLLQPENDWIEKRLGTVSSLKARIGWQGLTTEEYLDSGEYYLVTGTEFENGYINWNNCPYVSEWRYKQDRNIQLAQHDILVTKDGTIGKVALITNLEKPATLNSGVFVIRPRDKAFHPEFFYYLLNTNVFTGFLAQLSAGSTINHLYQKDFVNFAFSTPPRLEEQAEIANILSDMDQEITALDSRLRKAKQIKEGMAQELLTGKIRLV